MNPFPIFKSQNHFHTYIDCLNKIEIGDKVECMFVNSAFVGVSFRFPPGWQLGRSNWDEDLNKGKLILPIIGKENRPHRLTDRTLLYATVVGIPDHYNPLVRYTCYNQDDKYRSTYNIPNQSRGLSIFTNIGLDILYTKIIKRK